MLLIKLRKAIAVYFLLKQDIILAKIDYIEFKYMKTLYLLCGMPFSGKTTLGKSLSKYLYSPYISLDEINEARGLQGGEGIPVEEWEKTHLLAMQQLPSLMQSQQDIIIDDTSCFRWLRERWRTFVQQYDYQTIIIFFDIPLASYHQDPFDRMLISQAIDNDLIIVTTDSKFSQYEVELI